MPSIPIYNQQVAPPRKPRDVNAGAEWQAVGAVAQQVQQVGSAFAGRLFDLAAQNERNKAVVEARDQWRTFWSDLQKDPEYTSYGEKFGDFYSKLRDTVQRDQKMPRARRETGQQFEALRTEWADAVQKLSDERAIDHSRTIRVQSINQAVADLDIGRLVQELNESKKTLEFTESDLAKMKDTAIRQIIADKTMEYARMMGDVGMQWIMSDEAMAQFEYEESPEEKYFLDADTRNQMAVQLSQERTNRLKAAEVADFQRKKLVMDFVRGEISSGRLSRADQLYDVDYQQQFQQQFGMPMGLNDEDRQAISTMLADKAEAVEKDREAYSDDLLEIVKDAVEAGDAETAQRYLTELIEGGYGVDSMGRPDPEVRRYMEQAQRIEGGGGLTALDRDANAMRAKLRAGTLNRKDLAEFLDKHADKEGRLEHDKMWNELQQQEREREERASKKGAESEELLLADYVSYFHRVYGGKSVGKDELIKLDQWRYRNYPRNERDRNLPGIPENDFVNWGKLIATKLEEIEKDKSGLRTKMKSMGENRLNEYWDPILKNYEGTTRPGQLKKMAELQNERDRMTLDYLDMVKDETVSPVDAAQQLINGRAKIEVESLYGPEYKAQGAGVELPGGGESPMRRFALGETLPSRAVAPETSPELAKAKRMVVEFSRFSKDDNGLIIRRNKTTGDLSLYDNVARQWIKTDETRLTEYAMAAAMVAQYE
jgi:hypothetical protein